MAIDTKPNFSSKKFEQCSNDIMNLSGCTQIYSMFDIETGATLTICENASVGKLLTSDATGVATWQKLGTPSGIQNTSTNISSGTTHNHCYCSNSFVTGTQGILVDENNQFYLDDLYISDANLPYLNTFDNITSNTNIGFLPTGQTLGMVYITNIGSAQSTVNLGTTALGNDITPFQPIVVEAGEDVSVTVNMRLSLTQDTPIYINSDSWTNITLNVQWAHVTFNNVPFASGGTSGIQTASNGLTKTGSNVTLGGALTDPTGLYGDGYTFQLGTSTRRLDILGMYASGLTTINVGDSGSGVNRTAIDLLETGISIQAIDSSNITNSIGVGQTNMIVTDAINSKGLEYAGAYEDNFTTCSLVSKAYVDNLISSGSSIVHGNNIYTALSTPTNLVGTCNVLFGVGVGDALTSGDNNVGIGRFSLCDTTIGNWNVGIGINTLLANISGNTNVGIGNAALSSNIDGDNNIGIGNSALVFNVSGDYNIGVGVNALQGNVSGLYNLGIGYQALKSNLTGNTNVAIGPFAGNDNVTGSSNIFIGSTGGYSETGSCKLIIDNAFRGSEALGRTNSLIYAEMDDVPANQLFRINSQVELPHLSGKTTETCGLYIDGTGKLSTGVISGGTGGSPVGADGSMQYKDGSIFGGTGLVWDDSVNHIGWGTSARTDSMFSIRKDVSYDSAGTIFELFGEDYDTVTEYSQLKIDIGEPSNGACLYLQHICGYNEGAPVDLKINGSSSTIGTLIGQTYVCGDVISSYITDNITLGTGVHDVTVCSYLKFNPTTSPSVPTAGSTYYNSSTNELQYYNGTAWVVLSASGGTTVSGITSASNGLTESGGNITLGGVLSIPTTISSLGNTFLITTTDGDNVNNYTQISNASILSRTENANEFTNVNQITGNGTGNANIEISAGNSSTNKEACVLVQEHMVELYACNCTEGLSKVWLCSNEGLQYADDYSDNYNARSLVDAAYVTGQTVNIKSVTSSENITKVINQASHGFVLRDVIGFSGNTYNKAIADGTYDGESLGIVSEVVDTNNFKLTQAGYVTGITGLVSDSTYFLSDVTYGLLTPTKPTTIGHISNTILIAASTTTAWVLPYVGYTITAEETGGGTASGENITKLVNQVGHGFALNDVAGFSGGTYNKPIADGSYNGEVLGMVTEVIDDDNFYLSQTGYVSGLTGLVVDTTYFLSDFTAGLLTSTEPITNGHLAKAVLIATSTTSGWILPYAGYYITTGGTGGGTGSTYWESTGANSIGLCSPYNTIDTSGTLNITGDTLNISTDNLFMPNITGCTNSDVLYYNNGNGTVSYGTAPSGGIAMSGATVNGLTTYVDANTICAQSGFTYNDSTKKLVVNNFIVNCSPVNSNFIGTNAGNGATSATNSNFLGICAGYQATNAYGSNFLGYQAGRGATDAKCSNFLGYQAGQNATGAQSSHFLGNLAGFGASGAYYSNFIGDGAGYQATNAYNSNFLGYNAGCGATNAYYSNFLGYHAGFGAEDSSNSNLIGRFAGKSFTGNDIGCNNIIIGTNISLPNGTTDSINIGGVIFGTDTYSTIAGDASITPKSTAKIGIGMIPTTDTLEISGNTTINGSLSIVDGTQQDGYVLTSDGSGSASWQVGASGGTGGTSYTFSNGITESGGAVKLGGDLTENTCVNGDNNTLTFSGSSNYIFDNSAVGGGKISLLAEQVTCLAGCNVSAYLGSGRFCLIDNTSATQIELDVGGDTRFCNLAAKTSETDVVYINSSTGRLVTGATTAVTPGGSNGQLQYNNGSVFSGTTLEFDDSVNTFKWGTSAASALTHFTINSFGDSYNDADYFKLKDCNGSYDVIRLSAQAGEYGVMAIDQIHGMKWGSPSALCLSASSSVYVDNTLNIKTQTSLPSSGNVAGDMVRLSTDDNGIYAYINSKWADVIGKKDASVTVFASTEDVVTGDGTIPILIPASMNYNYLYDVMAGTTVPSTGGTTTDIQIRRVRSGTGTDLLSTKVTLGIGEYFANDGVRNLGQATVNTGDVLFVDVDAAGDASKGLYVTLTFSY